MNVIDFPGNVRACDACGATDCKLASSLKLTIGGETRWPMVCFDCHLKAINGMKVMALAYIAELEME
jgi:hypothetical protein